VIAINIHETFSYLTVDRDFYVARGIDDKVECPFRAIFALAFGVIVVLCATINPGAPLLSHTKKYRNSPKTGTNHSS
jgi:hypothetical protein